MWMYVGVGLMIGGMYLLAGSVSRMGIVFMVGIAIIQWLMKREG